MLKNHYIQMIMITLLTFKTSSVKSINPKFQSREDSSLANVYK